MNLKYIVSYLGLVPFLYLILDGYFIEILDITFILDVSIFMACIIFTFIGAYNWDFKDNNFILDLFLTLRGLFPTEYYLRLRIPITATLSLSLIILSRLYDSHI